MNSATPQVGDHLSSADLAAYHDGALPEDRFEEAREHLRRCPYCRERLRDLEKRRSSLKGPEFHAPPRTRRDGGVPTGGAPRRLRLALALLALLGFLAGLLLAARHLPEDRYLLEALVPDSWSPGRPAPVHVRVLERETRRPATGVEVRMALEGGPGFEARTDEAGLAEGTLEGPDRPGPVRFLLEARSALARSFLEGGLAAGEERRFLLTTKSFRVQPGEALEVRLAVQAWDEPTRSEPVRLELRGPDGVRRWMGRLEPAASGLATARVVLDPAEQPGMHLLVAEGGGETAWLPLQVGSEVPSAPGPDLVLPGGSLRRGVDNEVLLRVPRAEGPAVLEVEGREQVGTARGGVARFWIRPTGSEVELRVPGSGSTPFPVLDGPGLLALRVASPTVEAGTDLSCRVEASSDPGPVAAELRQDGRVLARRIVRPGTGPVEVGLPVPREASGLAEVVAFPLDPEAAPRAADSRRVVVRPLPGPGVDLQVERQVEADRARVRVAVTVSGKPAAASVALSSPPPDRGVPALPGLLDLLATLPSGAPEALAALVEQEPGLGEALGSQDPGPAWLLARGPASEPSRVLSNPSRRGDLRLPRAVLQGGALGLLAWLLVAVGVLLAEPGRTPWALMPLSVLFLAVLPSATAPGAPGSPPPVVEASLLAPLLLWASSQALVELVGGRAGAFARTAGPFLLFAGLLGLALDAGSGPLEWGLAFLVAAGLATTASTLAHRQEPPGPLAFLAFLGLSVLGGVLTLSGLVLPGSMGLDALVLLAQAAAVLAWTARASVPWPAGLSMWEPTVVLLFGGVLFAAVLQPDPFRSHALGGAAACQAHLQALRTAVELYARDSEGRVPLELSRLVPRYLQALPTCPAADKDTYSPGYLPRGSRDGFDLACRGFYHGDAGLGQDEPALRGGAEPAFLPETTTPPEAAPSGATPGWRPDVRVGSSGKAEAVLDLPSEAREIEALVHARPGEVTRVRTPVPPAPLVVEAALPTRVAPGEVLRIPVDLGAAEAVVHLQVRGQGVEVDSRWRDVPLAGGRGRLVLEARAGREGSASLELDARCRQASVKRTLAFQVEAPEPDLVARDGGVLGHPGPSTLPAPVGRLRLRVWRDAAALIEDALESLEDGPDAPEVRVARVETAALALRVLRASGHGDPSREEALRERLGRALQAFLSLRRADGALGPRPGAPEDPDLAREGLRALAAAARELPLDPRLLPELSARVAAHLGRDGSWGGDGRRTAEALLALQLADREPEARRRALAWLEGREPGSEALLPLARVAAGMDLPSPWMLARLRQARARLDQAPAEVVELLRLRGGRDAELVRGLGLLMRARDARGGWGSPAATRAAVRALAAAAPRLQGPDDRLEVRVGGQKPQALPSGPRAELELEGRGPGVGADFEGSSLFPWQVLQER